MLKDARGRRRGTRQTYSVVCKPTLVAQIEQLVDAGLYRSRSHAFEDAARLLITYHRDRFPAGPQEDRDVA